MAKTPMQEKDARRIEKAQEKKPESKKDIPFVKRVKEAAQKNQ